MTYNLAVWEGDQPADDAAAEAEFERLHARYAASPERVLPTARIAGFVAVLLGRFPDIGTDEGEDSPWAAGPLLREARGSLLYFALSWGEAEEVSAWVTQVADAHGLNCYDPQHRRLRRAADEPAMPLVDKRALRDAAVRRLSGLLVDRGWQATTASRRAPAFARPAPAGLVFALGPYPAITSDGVTFTGVTVSAGHLELGRLHLELLGHPPRSGLDVAVGAVRMLEDLLRADGVSFVNRTRWTIRSEDEVDAVVAALLEDFAAYGEPFLGQFADLGDVIAWTYADRGYQARDGILAIACALDGRPDEAAAVLRDYAAYGVDQVGRMLEQTTGFVRRFVDHFGVGADALRGLPAR